jgi:hypothetical protein
MSEQDALITGAIISGAALVIGYVAAFVREVVLEARRAARERDARLELRQEQRDERQRGYLVDLQEQLAVFARAMGEIHAAHMRVSREAGKWTLTLPDKEHSEADIAARTRISAVTARILDPEVRRLVGEAVTIERSLALPDSMEESQEALNLLMERTGAAHRRIGEVLRSLEAGEADQS